MENSGTEAGEDNPVHVVNASIAPQTAVESPACEDDEGEYGIPRGEAKPGGEIAIHGDRPQLEVHIKADEQGEVVGEVYSYDVQ